MEKTVIVGGQEMRMRASALIPRLYRFKFGRDIVVDMNRLRADYNKAAEAMGREDLTEEEKNEAQLSVLDLTIFENIAWLMNKHADSSVPDEPGEWLDTIDGIFSVYEIMPQILELWDMSNATTSIPRKK